MLQPLHRLQITSGASLGVQSPSLVVQRPSIGVQKPSLGVQRAISTDVRLSGLPDFYYSVARLECFMPKTQNLTIYSKIMD